jgi:hypothetical protein
VTGFKGAQGDIGVRGNKGEHGDRGIIGDKGEQGLQVSCIVNLIKCSLFIFICRDYVVHKVFRQRKLLFSISIHNCIYRF